MKVETRDGASARIGRASFHAKAIAGIARMLRC
jgi:hypothetical protein